LTSFRGQKSPEERKADGFTEFTLSFAEILDASTEVTTDFDLELFPDKDPIQLFSSLFFSRIPNRKLVLNEREGSCFI
jgi:hypothetical protein